MGLIPIDTSPPLTLLLSVSKAVQPVLYIYNAITEFLITCPLDILMIMIILIHKKDTLQVLADNKQQSTDLRMPVGSYK